MLKQNVIRKKVQQTQSNDTAVGLHLLRNLTQVINRTHQYIQMKEHMYDLQQKLVQMQRTN